MPQWSRASSAVDEDLRRSAVKTHNSGAPDLRLACPHLALTVGSAALSPGRPEIVALTRDGQPLRLDDRTTLKRFNGVCYLDGLVRERREGGRPGASLAALIAASGSKGSTGRGAQWHAPFDVFQSIGAALPELERRDPLQLDGPPSSKRSFVSECLSAQHISFTRSLGV